ncbi:MAG: hypothetical protein WCS69_00120 [Ignavibacteriaceae bacterium]
MDKLINFMFPVAERKVYFGDENGNPVLTEAYQAIIREDNGKLISVMSDTYRIVPNAEIIQPLMEQLQTLDSKWIIDSSHSFVSDQRMRLQVTFPELTFNDGRSDIALSLFLHNSYMEAKEYVYSGELSAAFVQTEWYSGKCWRSFMHDIQAVSGLTI